MGIKHPIRDIKEPFTIMGKRDRTFGDFLSDRELQGLKNDSAWVRGPPATIPIMVGEGDDRRLKRIPLMGQTFKAPRGKDPDKRLKIWDGKTNPRSGPEWSDDQKEK